jgi:large subunit ribosomal protein L28
MSRVCELTGIRPLSGHNVSHSNIKTAMRQHPNLQKKKYHIDELSESVTLTLSTRGIRTIDKHGGISRALLKADQKTLSPRLTKIRHRLVKAGQGHSAKKKAS